MTPASVRSRGSSRGLHVWQHLSDWSGSCWDLPSRNFNDSILNAYPKIYCLVLAIAVMDIMQHHPEITVFGCDWRRRTVIGFDNGRKFATSKIRSYVKLASLQ